MEAVRSVIYSSMNRLKIFYSLTAPYWKSREGRIGWLLLATSIMFQGLVTYSSLKFAEWNSAFYNALESRDASRILHEVIYFIILLSAMSIIKVNFGYFLSWVKLHWRRWMTEHCTKKWLSDNRFYHIRQKQNIDNVDQRISEEIRSFTSETLDLGFDCLSALLSVGSFSIVLWNLSGTLDFSFAGIEYSLAGYLLYGAVIYAIAGFFCARIVGRRIKPLSWENQKTEADYRAHMMRITEHNEAIAFARAAERESSTLGNYFSSIYRNSKDLMKERRRFNLYTLFYGQAMLVAPLFLSMPRYLSGALSLGDLMQLRIAFSQVVGSLSWFTNAYPSIMSWFATMDRLSEIVNEINKSKSESRIRYENNESSLDISDLSLFKPSGEPMFQIDQWSLNRGDRYHLHSKSGSGKTSLIKAIKGLWSNAEGNIAAPEDVLVLSQRDFIPLGTLKEAMTYPYRHDHFSNDDYQQALESVGLSHLHDQLDNKENWHQLLSGGERQRLALSRCFLLKPRWLILDESLSGIDENTGRSIVETLFETLPDTGILCISHARWTRDYFRQSLTLQAKIQPKSQLTIHPKIQKHQEPSIVYST